MKYVEGVCRDRSLFRKLSRFDGVDLQRDVAAVDTALRKCAAGKPQARLGCGGPDVAKLLCFVIKTPDRPNALGDGFAEARGDDVRQWLSGRNSLAKAASSPLVSAGPKAPTHCVTVWSAEGASFSNIKALPRFFGTLFCARILQFSRALQSHWPPG